MKRPLSIESILSAGVCAVLPPIMRRPLVAVELGYGGCIDATLASLAILTALKSRYVPWRFLTVGVASEDVQRAARAISGVSPRALQDVEFVSDPAVTSLSASLDAIGPVDFLWASAERSRRLSPHAVECLLGHVAAGGLLMLEHVPEGVALDALSAQRLHPDGVLADATEEIRLAILEPPSPMLIAGGAVPFTKLMTLIKESERSPRVVTRTAPATESAPSRRAPFRVNMTTGDEVALGNCWNTARQLFPETTRADFASALAAVACIESRIHGRHCGDLGDKLTQYLAVAQHIRTNPNRPVRVLEIGTLFGGSCLMSLSAMRDLRAAGTVTCIDPLSGYYGEDADPQSGLPVDPATLFANLASCGFSPECIELRRCLSSDARATEGLEQATFDVLMIDGDHSGDGVRNDWVRFSPYVADEGTIVIDDYAESGWSEITTAVDALCSGAEWNRAGVFGTTLIARRRACGVPDADGRSASPTAAPSIGEIVRALMHDRYAAGDWSARLASVLSHLRDYAELDVELNLGRAAQVRGEWDVAERWFRSVVSRSGVTPVVLLRAWLGLADCAGHDRRDDCGELSILETAADVERRLAAYGYSRRDASNRLRRARALRPDRVA